MSHLDCSSCGHKVLAAADDKLSVSPVGAELASLGATVAVTAFALATQALERKALVVIGSQQTPSE